MPGHNGGARGSFFLDSATLADDVERRMDAIGWSTAHIVGNSLGGWVAFELERRGRARTLTGIAPAGGWHHYTPAKFEIVAKFVAGFPVWPCDEAARKRALKLPFARQLAFVPSARTRTPSTTTTCPTSSTTSGTARPTTNCWSNRCAARPDGIRRRARTHPPRDLRKRPGAAAPALHPALHDTLAGVHDDHPSRWGRARPDVRGTPAGHRRDHSASSTRTSTRNGRRVKSAQASSCAASSVSLSVLLGRITAVVFSRSG